MSLGTRIKFYREKLGMSLQDVADHTDVSRVTIFHYETGNISKIPLKNIEDIAMCLQVKPCTLCEWDEKLATCNSKAIYTTDDLYDALAERLPLTADEIKQAVAFAIAMKGNRDEKI